ncbi:hypothetical protein L0244_21040, partial [bacterium]|nr:hypothetical protein [bacterium]
MPDACSQMPGGIRHLVTGIRHLVRLRFAWGKRSMIHKDDWRLKLRPRKYLEKITLQWNQFKAFREGMDSDHCEFCWAKFVPEPKPDAHHEGYTTADHY